MVNTMILQFEEYDRKIFWALLMLAASAVILYVYFISIGIIAVVARKETERELGRMTTQVATLEGEYASLDKAIDLELAHREGFVDVSVPRYISTTGEKNSLTLRGSSLGQ